MVSFRGLRAPAQPARRPGGERSAPDEEADRESPSRTRPAATHQERYRTREDQALRPVDEMGPRPRYPG